MATIRKRTLPSGKVAWQVDFKDGNGKRRARQFPTKREADAFMVKARAEVATGTYVHDADSVTVGEAGAQWLAACAQRRDVGRRMEKATWVGYECHVRLHICEPDIGIGRIKLSRLTRKVINEFRDRLLSGGRSETTTRKILSSLNLIVRHAQENGMIVQNPVQGVQVIRSSRLKGMVRVPAKENEVASWSRTETPLGTISQRRAAIRSARRILPEGRAARSASPRRYQSVDVRRCQPCRCPRRHGQCQRRPRVALTAASRP